MNREVMADELDRQLEELLRGRRAADSGSGPLLAVAAELQMLPDPEFVESLKEVLIEEGPGDVGDSLPAPSRQRLPHPSSFAKDGDSPPLDSQPFPLSGLMLFSGRHSALFPADQRSFLVSFISHAALIALIASGIFVSHDVIVKRSFLTSELAYPPPAGHGGGGSGERSPIRATKGTPPRFSDQQIAPPVIVVHTDIPKLPVESTVLGPPQIKLPESSHIGDLVSTNIVIPSNGTGGGGGAGDGSGTGLGRGDGAGVGTGKDWGYGGGSPSRMGITAPRAIYDPEPEYSEEARKVKHQGVVVLTLVVDAQGRTRDIRVARSLGMGLDEKAIDAVKKWKFAPGTSNGVAVSMQVNVEVNFRLF